MKMQGQYGGDIRARGVRSCVISFCRVCVLDHGPSLENLRDVIDFVDKL